MAVTREGGTVLLRDGPAVTSAEVEEIFYRLCRNAVYARKEEIAAGFLTAPGGHRVGLCGRAVLEKGRVAGVKELTSLNIRISRRHRGAARELIPLLLRDDPCSALLFGPPLSGKTTVLRELSYEAAHMGYRVAVVDEREELALPLAPMDVFRGYPRKQGVWQALRLFSPDILVFDELGDPEDVEALQSVAQSGVALFTTVHAADLGQLQKRPLLGDVMKSGIFHRLIRLSSGVCPGRVLEVYDGAGNALPVEGKGAVTR